MSGINVGDVTRIGLTLDGRYVLMMRDGSLFGLTGETFAETLPDLLAAGWGDSINALTARWNAREQSGDNASMRAAVNRANNLPNDLPSFWWSYVPAWATPDGIAEMVRQQLADALGAAAQRAAPYAAAAALALVGWVMLKE
jgi:hypothetical protein